MFINKDLLVLLVLLIVAGSAETLTNSQKDRESVLTEKLCTVAERKDRTGCLELDIKIHLKLVYTLYW